MTGLGFSLYRGPVDDDGEGAGVFESGGLELLPIELAHPQPKGGAGAKAASSLLP